MNFSRPRKRLTALIAACAILLAALAPSLSYALAAGQGGNAWTEICSVTGIKLVKTGQDAPGQGKHAADSGHCSFCSGHANPSVLPTAAGLALPASGGGVSHPPLFYQSPRPLFVWNSAPSRAPPFSS